MQGQVGVPVGNDVMFARGSLNELSRSLTQRCVTVHRDEISQPWADGSTSC